MSSKRATNGRLAVAQRRPVLSRPGYSRDVEPKSSSGLSDARSSSNPRNPASTGKMVVAVTGVATFACRPNWTLLKTASYMTYPFFFVTYRPEASNRR